MLAYLKALMNGIQLQTHGLKIYEKDEEAFEIEDISCLIWFNKHKNVTEITQKADGNITSFNLHSKLNHLKFYDSPNSIEITFF